MKYLWKNIMCLLCSCCVCSYAQAEDLDPESSAYLLDMKYAKNIEVKAYLVTKNQLAQLFGGENVTIVQKTNKELRGQDVYLLIRCKNTGDYRSFGILNCKLPNTYGPITIEIETLPGYMKNYYDSAVQKINSGILRNDDNKPIVSCEWKSLYTI